MKKIFFASIIMISIAYASPAYRFPADARNFIDLQTINPTICIEMRYAMAENFTGKKVYSDAGKRCFVHKDMAEKLDVVQKDLKKHGLGLKIWDGLRTFAAQRAFWAILPDPRYVGNPEKGGRHTRGTAVDLTLIRLSDGKELEMPTKFDDFSEKAHHNYRDASPEAIKNKEFLKNIMMKHGFELVNTEWWHYDLKGWREYEPFRGDFEDLVK